ncbi:MAG: YraN family protein [Candidatus Sumerlaeaceae bacterium]|nr:YraN family protein [Candidatus Sumerlaeaceae bacterium]
MSVPRKSLNRALGNAAEQAVADMLQAQGWRILERNFRCRAGEIDIIAEDHGQIVFIEVKARSPRAWQRPAEAVDETKQHRLTAAARTYLRRYREPSPHRFDIASVCLDESDRIAQIDIEHSAFGR